MTSTASTPLGQRNVFLALVLLALVLAAFAPSFRGVYLWDDSGYLIDNQTLRQPGFSGLGQIWLDLRASQDYYPLVFTMFWAEYRLWGLAPLGYHLVNAGLHAAGAVLLWQILRRLGLRSAWWAAALWAVHPVQVESVAWVTERKNVLSGVLFFAALLSYLRFAGVVSRGAPQVRSWLWWTASALLFLAAMLAKTVTCVLPLVLVVILWWQRPRLAWRDLLPLAPLLALAAVVAKVQIWVQQNHCGALGPEFDFTFAQRLLIAGRDVWFYVSKLLWPRTLMQIYPRFEIDARQLWQWLFPAAALAVLLGLWLLRRRIGRGPLAAAACFVLLLLPALGFVSFYTMLFTFVADHYQYLAMAALLPLLTELARRGLAWLAPRVSPQRAAETFRALAAAAALLVFAPLLYLTTFYAELYRSDIVLWSFNVHYNPSGAMPVTQLGSALLNAAERLRPRDARGAAQLEAEGERALLRAIELAPHDERAYIQLTQFAFLHKEPDKFRRWFTAMTQRVPVPRGPGQGTALFGGVAVRAAGGDLDYFLGVIYLNRHEPQQALMHFRANLAHFPAHARGYLGAGQAHAALRQFGPARECLTRAAQLAPADATPLLELAKVAFAEGKSAEAVELFARARQIDPRVARGTLPR